MSLPRFFKSLFSTATPRLASSRSHSKKRTSYRPLLEALESRLVPALNVPVLNSYPSAAHTLYLDFDGSDPFLWGRVPDTGDPYVVRGPSPDDAPIPVPPFTLDADADPNGNDFSAAEKAAIRNIHAWVAEKFSPFWINVTTVDPGVVVDSQNMTCLIGGSSSDWLGRNAGGVADRGGFIDDGENTCFAFSAGVSSATIERFVGETIAHEAGHVVGLSHQRHVISADATDEYYDGDALRAPIMGDSSNNPTARGLWWLTNNFGQNSPDAPQDDLFLLTQGGISLFYKSDDYNTNTGEMVFNPTGALPQQKGIIERNGDVDGFRFQATGVRVSFLIKNAPFGGMLAPTASIRIDGTNTLIPVNLTVTTTTATIEATNLTPGTTYVLQVAGQGQSGDLGQYTIDGLAQQFATFDPASGRVNVGGFVGRNNVTLRTGRGNSLIVEDSVNGGPTVRVTFALNAVTGVHVFLGSGDDTLNIAGLTRANGSTVEVISTLGGGNDTLRLGSSGNDFSTFNVDEFAFEWTPFDSDAVHTSRVRDTGTERVELIGTNDRDVFNITSQQLFTTIHVFGKGDNDRLYLGPRVVTSFLSFVRFEAGSGTDTLEMDGSTLVDPQEFVVFNDRVGGPPGGVLVGASTSFGTALEVLRVRGGSGNDSFKVLGLRAGMTAFLSGGGGDDEFRVGDSANPNLALPFSANVRGIVNVVAGSDSDRLVVDDASWGSVGNYTIDNSGVKNTFVNNWVQYEGTLERVDFHSRNGETTRLTSQFTAQEFHLFNGPGNGVGTLIVDDRSAISGPNNLALHPDRIDRNFTIGITREIHYSGYESLTVISNNSTNAINVFGTSADITQQTTIRTGTRNDVVTLYPRGADGASDPTIVTPLGFFGGEGSDTFRVDATASASSIDYLFNHAGGASTLNIFGLGPAAVGAFSDVEMVDVLAGDGNDTFTTDALKTGAALLISGGEGADQFQVRDQGTAAPRRFDLGITQAVGSETVGTIRERSLNGNTNLLNARYEHVESVPVNGGSGGNLIKVAGTPVDTSVFINAGTDDDTVEVGSITLALGPINSLRDIRGPLSIDGQDGTDDVFLRDNADPSARDYTLTPTMVARSDAPAAPILHANLETLALKGSVGDNVFALTSLAFAPLVSINGGGGVNTLDYSLLTSDTTSGLVARYGGEGNADDSAGGNHGTIQGDVTFVPGQVGQAFDFDGVDDHVDLGSDPSLDLPGSMSVSLWVRLDTLDHAKYFLADFSDGSTSQGSLGTTGDASTFAWVQSHTVGAYVTLSGTTPIQLNQWYHLAVVRDDEAKIVRLYVNGVEDGSLSYAGQTVLALQGSKILGGSGPDFPTDFMDGQLDEVGIYNRALSVAEIQTLAGNPSVGEGVMVNLPLGTASGLLGGIARIQNLVGSSGNDILVGNGVFGGIGGNVLTGGGGRDLLIAGAVAGILNGGDDEDLLIGGRTNYDRNADALLAIMAEWNRMNGNNDGYAARVANLKNGANGLPILNATTVRSNGDRNTLQGVAGLDFFFANTDDPDTLDTLDRDPLTEEEELVEL